MKSGGILKNYGMSRKKKILESQNNWETNWYR